MCEVAKKHGIVLVVPIYEEEISGLYYNTASVIDADGTRTQRYWDWSFPEEVPDARREEECAEELRALLIDAVPGLQGTIWRISAAPRRKARK